MKKLLFVLMSVAMIAIVSCKKEKNGVGGAPNFVPIGVTMIVLDDTLNSYHPYDATLTYALVTDEWGTRGLRKVDSLYLGDTINFALAQPTDDEMVADTTLLPTRDSLTVPNLANSFIEIWSGQPSNNRMIGKFPVNISGSIGANQKKESGTSCFIKYDNGNKIYVKL